MSKKQADGSLGFLLTKGTLALQRQLNRGFTANNLDLTTEQLSILAFLYHCDGKSQHEIAEKTFRDKVSVTKIVDNLEKRKLVYRLSDDNDRRVKRIHLSKEGYDLVPRLKKIAHETIKIAFKGIKLNELEVFKNVISKMTYNITGEDLLKFINTNKGRWK